MSAALFADLPIVIGQVVLFAERATDAAFLRQLYRTTREDELATVDWSAPVKQAFCDSQYDLQHAHYQRQYPAAAFLVLWIDEVPIGRLYLDASGSNVHLIDLALLPAWRGKGIGSALLSEVQHRATASSKGVSLNVHIWNQGAIALYRRHGFADQRVVGAHLAMRWTGGVS